MRHFFGRYGSYYRSILSLGMPIMLGQVGIILTGFCDTLMVGHYSTEALASASFVNNVFTLVTVLCMGFSYGITPIIGALYARGDNAAIGHTMRNAVVLNMAFGAVALVVMAAFYELLDDLGQPEELLPLIRPYFIVILLSNIPVIFVNAMKQFSDGITDTKLGMWVLTAGNALNVALNYVMIYGKCGMPEMGLLGAGISTLVSRTAMAAAYIVVMTRGRRYAVYKECIGKARLQWSTLREIYRTSMPIALQMGFETGSFTAASVMIGWLGKAPLAAYQVMVIIGMLGFMIYYSIGASIAIKIANYNGAGEMRKVRECAMAGYHIMLLCALAACTVFYLFCEPIIRLFTTDTEVIAVAMTLIVPMILYQFGDATQVAYANALRGLADVKPMMLIAATAYVIIGLPVCYLLGFPCNLGIVGIYLSFSISLVTAGGLFMYRFYSHFPKISSATKPNNGF